MKSALRKTATASGALVAACAACCAPLLIAPAAALIAASGLSLAFLGQVGIGVLVIVGAAGLVLWRRRRRATTANCGCASSRGNTLNTAMTDSTGPAATRCSPPG